MDKEKRGQIMSSYRKDNFPKQYLWVSQEFYNVIMGKSKELKKKGLDVGSSRITHEITPIVQTTDFETIFKRKRRW